MKETVKIMLTAFRRDIHMSNALKNVLWKVFAAAMVIVGIVWFLQDDTKPIEDTNGPDNFFLQVITDRNIIERDMGMVGGIKIRSDLIGSGITFSSDGFTGVYEVLYDNYVLPSDFHLELTNLTVTGGNFRAVIVHDDKIVEELEFNSEDNLFIDYLLEDVTGTVSLRLAGESAAFSFSMMEGNYDSFAHS